MNYKSYIRQHNKIFKAYQIEANKLAKEYLKENVNLKKGVVYEASKGPRGLTNRFVVFIVNMTRYSEIGLVQSKAGIWWLDKENNCSKWETLHGVDNKEYKKSSNQKFIKPVQP